MILVVGGGVAGLVFALDVARAGRSVTVIEAGSEFGGQVRAAVVGGVTLDVGAEAFATRGGAVERLARDVGLGDRIERPTPSGSWLLPRGGRAVPLPRGTLLGIPSRPLALDVVRAIGLPAALRARSRDRGTTGSAAAGDGSLGELVERRMGRSVVEALVGPVAHGVYSRSPWELEADAVAPGLADALARSGSLRAAVGELLGSAGARDGSRVARVRGGMASLVERLVSDLEARGAALMIGATARVLDAHRVEVAGRVLEGDVVLATSAGLAGVERSRAHVVTLVVDESRLDARPRGTGVLVAPGHPDVRARALTHSTAKWADLAREASPLHVVRLSYSDPVDDELVLADASRLLGASIRRDRVVALHRTSWDRASRAEYRGPAAWTVGEWVAGTGLASVVRHAREQAGSYLDGTLTPAEGPSTVG